MLHRWGLGFRQYSFRPITRVLRDDTFSVFRCPPLFRHAPFPSGFRLPVNRMTQEQPSGLLLTESGIQHRVPRRTLSPHPAFQVTTTLLRGSRPDIWVSQGRTRRPRDMAPDISAFPVWSVGPCLEATAGTPFTILSVTSLLLPWRTFTLYIPLQDIIWLLRRLRLPQRPLAFSRLQAWLVSRCRDNLVDFPSSEARDDRTFSCLLHAGWSSGQRGLGGGSLTPATLPFGPGVLATSTC